MIIEFANGACDGDPKLYKGVMGPPIPGAANEPYNSPKSPIKEPY